MNRKPQAYRELVINIQSQILRLEGMKDIIIQWVPGHADIAGNEVADKGAKHALQSPTITRLTIPETVYKKIIQQAAERTWSEAALRAISSTHLGRIRSDTLPHPWASSKNRRVDVVLTRLRIGHTALKAHLFQIGLEPSANCEWCGEEEDIRHLFFNCFRHFSHRIELQTRFDHLQVPYITKNLLTGRPIRG